MLGTDGTLGTTEEVDAHILCDGVKTIRKPRPGKRHGLKISLRSRDVLAPKVCKVFKGLGIWDSLNGLNTFNYIGALGAALMATPQAQLMLHNY